MMVACVLQAVLLFCCLACVCCWEQQLRDEHGCRSACLARFAARCMRCTCASWARGALRMRDPTSGDAALSMLLRSVQQSAGAAAMRRACALDADALWGSQQLLQRPGPALALTGTLAAACRRHLSLLSRAQLRRRDGTAAAVRRRHVCVAAARLAPRAARRRRAARRASSARPAACVPRLCRMQLHPLNGLPHRPPRSSSLTRPYHSHHITTGTAAPPLARHGRCSHRLARLSPPLPRARPRLAATPQLRVRPGFGQRSHCARAWRAPRRPWLPPRPSGPSRPCGRAGPTGRAAAPSPGPRVRRRSTRACGTR
jgi:hypothetical protein